MPHAVQQETKQQSGPAPAAPAKQAAGEGAPGPQQAWNGYVKEQGGGQKPTLRQGSTGPWVQKLQCALNETRGESLATDGAFGPLTRAAAVRFQKAKGLDPDGVVGPMTWGALDGASPGKKTPPDDKKNLVGSLSAPEQQSLGAAYLQFLAELGKASLPAATAVAPAVQQSASLLASGQAPEDQVMTEVLNAIVLGIPQAVKSVPWAAPPAQVQAQALDVLHKHVASGFKAPIPVKVDLYLKRIDGMRAFYNSMSPTPAGPDPLGPQSGPTGPLAGARASMVGLALGEVGKVKAKAPLTDQDETGQPARPGWRDLKKYFDVAFGGAYADQAILRRPRAGNVPVGKDQDGKWKYKHTTDVLPHWCGIFATWAGKTGGVPLPNWKTGAGVSGSLKTASIPRVGDIAYKNAAQHHAVVVWVQPLPKPNLKPAEIKALQIRTVDGNSAAQSEITGPNGSTVGDWAVFYDVG